MGRLAERNVGSATVSVSIPHGIRIDALWELLVLEDLDGFVRGSNQGLVVQQYRRGATDTAIAQSIEIINKGWAALATNDTSRFKTAQALANKAIEMAPQYYGGYHLRSTAYLEYSGYSSEQNRESKEPAKYAKFALDDIRTCLKLAPSSPELYASYAEARCVEASYRGDFREAPQEVISLVSRLVETSMSNRDLARLWYAYG
jgi:hypothetical protein